MAGSLRGPRLGKTKYGTPTGRDPDDEWRRMGLLLRQMRINAGMHRRDWAEHMNRLIPDCRWTEDTVSLVQTGRRHLKLREMRAVAQIFKVTWAELLDIALSDSVIVSPPATKLTAAVAVDLRERYAAGESLFTLAIEFGVNESTVSRVVNGLTWKGAGGPINPGR